jgi:hypothetical protein
MNEKITVKRNWEVCYNGRVSIVNATYRQALTYICQLKNYGVTDTNLKPKGV